MEETTEMISSEPRARRTGGGGRLLGRQRSGGQTSSRLEIAVPVSSGLRAWRAGNGGRGSGRLSPVVKN